LLNHVQFENWSFPYGANSRSGCGQGLYKPDLKIQSKPLLILEKDFLMEIIDSKQIYAYSIASLLVTGKDISR
jgi:hypothetical protein